MLGAMSVIGRPRVLFLLGALVAGGACGGDDQATTEPADARSPDAAPLDAAPTGLVTLGARQVCPREIEIHGDEMYWLEDDVLVRSSIDAFSPEVLYTGVRGGNLRLGDGAAYWIGNWPVRLDLAERQARPLVASVASSLEIVDGVRPVVFDLDGSRIAEIDAKGNADELYAVATGSIGGLGRSGHWLLFRRYVNDTESVEWLDAVDGSQGSVASPGYFPEAAVNDEVAVVMGRANNGSVLRVIEDGNPHPPQPLDFFVSELALDGTGAVYAVNELNNLLFRSPTSFSGFDWTRSADPIQVTRLAGLADGVIAVSCEGSFGAATFFRWYP